MPASVFEAHRGWLAFHCKCSAAQCISLLTWSESSLPIFGRTRWHILAALSWHFNHWTRAPYSYGLLGLASNGKLRRLRLYLLYGKIPRMIFPLVFKLSITLITFCVNIKYICIICIYICIFTNFVYACYHAAMSYFSFCDVTTFCSLELRLK